MNRSTLAIVLLLLLATLVFSPFALLSVLLFLMLASMSVYLISVVFGLDDQGTSEVASRSE